MNGSLISWVRYRHDKVISKQRHILFEGVMASAQRLREQGKRRQAPVRARPSLLADSLGVHSNELGEKRMNIEQIYALEHMFQGHPAVQAARTVLSGQLLSGGISLRKDGKDVEIAPTFKDHLNEVWIPFAQDVIDSFLKWGIVAISYEEEENPVAKRQKRKAAEQKGVSKAKSVIQDLPPIVIPIVPVLGSYEIAFQQGGRQGYKRTYGVYSNAPGQGTRKDDEAYVVVRQHPDNVGNVNSPLASVFELGSFVGALTELAIIAESSRARPRMVTQMRKKDNNSLDPGNLFFDSDSRAVQAGADTEESTAQARALQLQQQMCQLINKLQTTQKYDHDLQSFGGSGQSKMHQKTGYAPPEVAPSLFHLPKDHEMCNNSSTPESRGDLESLSRLAIEQFSAAFGVPSDLIFSGRFAGKSTSQLSLLNTTVSQLAKSVNSVLTMCYRDIYSDGDSDVGTLQLLTSPLSATDEVLNLYAGGLVPVEVAMPTVMHAIGATKDEIDAALEKAILLQKKKEECERCDQEYSKADHEMTLKEREVNLKKVDAEAKKTAAEAKAAPQKASADKAPGEKS